MSLTEAEREKYIKYRSIKKLGDLFKYCYENDFYLEEDYNEYMYSDENGSDGLRIVYLNMIYEELIAEYERRDIEYYVAWQDPEEPPFRKEILDAFLSLMTFKLRGIDSVDGIVDYLNNYSVNPVLSANVASMMYALDDGGYIVNHWLIFYGDKDKEMWSHSYTHDHLYKLDLDSEIKNIDAKSLWRESFDISNRYSLHYDKNSIVELDSRIRGRLCHAKGGNWFMYEKENAEDTELPDTFAVCNVNTNKVTEYKGVVVSYNDGIVIVQYKNELYKVEGSDIRKIYSLCTDGVNFEYVDTEMSIMRRSTNRLLIAPVIRGAFIPYEIDYDGKYIGPDCTVAEYVWWSAFSLDYSLTKHEPLSYQWFHYTFRYGEAYEYEKFRLDEPTITVNFIKEFMNKYVDSEPELIKSMHPFILLVLTLGHVVDHDTDISELLLAIRNDYLRSTEEYWKKLLDTCYGNFDGRDEIVGNDLLSQRMSEEYKYVIGYKYNRFVSEDYVKDVVKASAQGELKDYIGNVWFKDGYPELKENDE